MFSESTRVSNVTVLRCRIFNYHIFNTFMVDGTLLHSVENGEMLFRATRAFYELTRVSRYCLRGWMSFKSDLFFRFDVKLLDFILGKEMLYIQAKNVVKMTHLPFQFSSIFSPHPYRLIVLLLVSIWLTISHEIKHTPRS